ncbi:hypothetical protein T190607A02C_150088 [Tenacibaculum sp. 190524A02b]
MLYIARLTRSNNLAFTDYKSAFSFSTRGLHTVNESIVFPTHYKS